MSVDQTPATGAIRPGRYRWVICWLLVAAMVFNYIDRQTLGLLKPGLQQELGWRETDFADMVMWFSAAYALAYLFWGAFVDRLGAKLGLAFAFAIWTVGHMLNGAATSIGGFIAARVVLGVGEAGAFPAGTKAIAEWFPKSERALATGVFNAGGNIGAIITPILVPFIVLTMGWRWAFVITGVIGFVWLPLWLWVYRTPANHPKVTPQELALIQQDPADPVGKISWRKMMGYRETWAYAAGKFCIDPIWWMYLYWLPDFLHKRHGLDLKNFGPPIVVIYLMSDFGSVAGGWMSSALLRRGLGINASRKLTMALCAVLVMPIALAAQVDSLWLAVGIIGLATAAHQGFSVNLLTLPSDVFPRKAIGAVIGIGGMIGALGGMAMSKYAGLVLEKLGSYTPIFILAATAYVIALISIHALTPRLQPVAIEGDTRR